MRVYLQLYFNSVKKAEEDVYFDNDMIESRRNIEAGVNIDDLPKNALKKVVKHPRIKRPGDDIQVTFNEDAPKEAKRRHGFFALVSNHEKNPFDCLCEYRKRETIESFFQSMKSRADGIRSWRGIRIR
ncbi:MAG: hypothetical protein LBO66_02880 [Deltaproteobacteria bacterium]|jgi:hypothetical protein|nr:hypothetical protein [Deltaproteobacteria bacterium]